MNDIPKTDSQEVLANIKPLTKAEVQSKFPDCIVQKSNSHSGSTTILNISDGTSKRLYYQISEDQYVPFTKDGEDVSDLISEVGANKSVKFMGARSVAFDMDTGALKVIDNKLVGPTYTEPYVTTYNLDGDYLERMILKEDTLYRAKLNGKEVILHDVSNGGSSNRIQFVGNKDGYEMVGEGIQLDDYKDKTIFSGELILDDENNIVLTNGKLLSRKEGLTQEWEIHGNNIVCIGSKCVSPDGEVLPITLLGEDISSKIEINRYGKEYTLKFAGIGATIKPVVNNITGEVLTYKNNIISRTHGHRTQGDTDIGICISLKGEETGVVLFDTKTFVIRPITLLGEDISEQLSPNWDRSSVIQYKGNNYTLDFNTGVLYRSETEVVNEVGDVIKVTFLGSNIPDTAQIVGNGLLKMDPNDDEFVVKFNTQTGEVKYKSDSSGKIFLELVSKYRSDSIENVVFYNPQTGVKVKIYDKDLLEEITKLPYADTQAVIDISVTAAGNLLTEK